MEKIQRNSINKKQNGLKYSKNDKSSTLPRKSHCIMFTYRGSAVTQMQGMVVAEQLKYLGVDVCNRGNFFYQHKKGTTQQARKMVI